MKKLILLTMITSLLTGFMRAQVADVSDLPPLDELGKNEYKGHTGGLYPDGSNSMPPAFYNDAVDMAKSVQPLDENGKPSANGKIGLVSVGASTVTMFARGLETQLPKVKGLNKELVFVDCAIGGQDLSKIMIPSANFWTVVDQRLVDASVSREQVQVVFFQEDNLKNRSADLDGRGKGLVADFTYMAQFLKQHYPNLKIIYLTGRHTTAFMPVEGKDKHREPRAYINGWACKWVIENQINGDPELSFKGPDAKAPLLMWGPYFWTQGTKQRADGYTWGPELLSQDGIHPNDAGIERVAKDLIDFWKQDPVSQLWFYETPGTVASSDLSYMNLMINKTMVDKILYSDLNEKIRVMVLKDTIVVYDKKNVSKKESYEITLKDAGDYKYLISDETTKAFAGKFTVKDDGSVEVEQKSSAEIPDSATSSNVNPKDVVDPNAPAWMVNGNNKMPKLKRILGDQDYVKAVFTDLKGNTILEVEDILNKHSDLNEALERGEYKVTFYDKSGQVIEIPEEFSDSVRIKY